MEQNPYKAPSAAVADVVATPGGLDVTWGRAVRVWWSLTWRLMLFGGLAGFVLGAIFGAIGGAAGASRDTLAVLGNLAGLMVTIPVGMWVVRNVLRKSWSDFEIALIERR